MRCAEELAVERLTVRLFRSVADLVLLYLLPEVVLVAFVLRPCVDTFDLVDTFGLVETFDLVLVDDVPLR